MRTVGLRLPSRANEVSFSGHETFVLRYGWLKKAFDAIVADPEIFSKADAVVTLGVGKNMVRSIRHWAIACGIAAEEPKSRGLRLAVTDFGTFLFGRSGRDPFLEDINSVWLLHWKLVTNESQATTWNWAFRFTKGSEFSPGGLFETFQAELARRVVKAPTSNTLKRDIEVFLRCYLPPRITRTVQEDSFDSPLSELGLVVHESGNTYSFVRGPHRTLSDEVFVFGLMDYWGSYAPERETLNFSEIAYGPNSPGTIFRLDEESLVERLDRIDRISGRNLSFDDTAGLKQVYRKRRPDSFSVLDEHYQLEVHC